MGIGKDEWIWMGNICSGSRANQQLSRDYIVDKYKRYRSCKDVFVSLQCISDADCNDTIIGKTNCDLFNGICRIPYEDQVLSFYRCVISQLDIVQENYIRDTFHISVPKTDPLFLSQFMEATSANDC